MRAGRQHQPARPERHGAAAHQCRDLVHGEATPDRGLGLDARAGGHRTIAQLDAEAELRIGRGIGMAVGERLGILPAGGSALVQHDDRCSGLRGGDRCRQPGRPRADHKHVAHLVLGFHAVGFVAERRQRQGRLTGDRHVVGHLRHARALADATIHRHHAVETGAHAAMQAARCAGGRAAVRDDAGGRQSGGDGLAFERGDG